MIGEKLGPFTIHEVVGTGSFGTVFRAEDPEGNTVALKLLRAQILNTLERREKFLRNVLAASEIRNPSLCPILEMGDDNDDFFVITPFIEGQNLQQYLGKKALPWQHALDIAFAAGSAIASIHHAGALHRGLKPTNIWIVDHREPRVLLSDSCIGPWVDPAHAGPHAASSFGLWHFPAEAYSYMSPEQILGEPLDPRSDIFSLGMVLYEMLSGRHPFETTAGHPCIRRILEAKPVPIATLPSAISSNLESILNRALAKNREDRYPTMQSLLADIGNVRDKNRAGDEQAKRPAGIGKQIASKFLRYFRPRGI